MGLSPGMAARILVIARPALGRKIEAALKIAGHQVYRTPDPSTAAQLETQLRPQLAVVALDLPWGDAEGAIARLCSSRRDIPVLVLGDCPHNGATARHSRLPLAADATDVQEAVADLLANPKGSFDFSA